MGLKGRASFDHSITVPNVISRHSGERMWYWVCTCGDESRFNHLSEQEAQTEGNAHVRRMQK